MARAKRRKRIDYNDYPPNWKTEIRPAVLARAGNRCEGSPAYPDCRAANGKPHPVTGSIVVLTIAHLHGTSKMTTDVNDLRAMCQRCHLFYDLEHHVHEAALTRRQRRIEAGQLQLEEAFV
jgi:hypothetical protein